METETEELGLGVDRTFVVVVVVVVDEIVVVKTVVLVWLGADDRLLEESELDDAEVERLDETEAEVVVELATLAELDVVVTEEEDEDEAAVVQLYEGRWLRVAV